MSELSTQAFPNGGGGFPQSGGWVFRQPQTGWQNPYPLVGFKASVDAIIKHRMSNKAVTAKHRLSTDRGAVEQELVSFNRARLGIAPAPSPSFFQRSRSSQSVGAVAAEDSWLRRITRLSTGVTTLKAWLGSNGKPVDSTLSESRASLCETCPKNISGDWLSLFTKPVAALIQGQIEERNRMSLSTSRDEKIGLCDACGCPLKLKVHVPVKFIRDHMKEPEIKNLDPRCWILSEA